LRIILLLKFLRSFSYLWIDDNFYESISLKNQNFTMLIELMGDLRFYGCQVSTFWLQRAVLETYLFQGYFIVHQFYSNSESTEVLVFWNDITWRNLRPFYSFLAIIAGWRRGGTASRTLTRGLTLLSFMLTSAFAEEGCWVTWKPQR